MEKYGKERNKAERRKNNRKKAVMGKKERKNERNKIKRN